MLETSVEDFVSRFADAAAAGQLYPQPEGSPLMEFVAGGRTLYLFDRTGPYTAKPGEARVIVHGTLARFAKVGSTEAKLSVVGVSGVEGVGQIIRLASRYTAVVQARVPLVLSSFNPLPPLNVGEWLSFETQPPLHGFLVTE